eukprot:Skav206423  [mRNA]  locus=scaffold292:423680:425227:+ [translate_table: standard]
MLLAPAVPSRYPVASIESLGPKQRDSKQFRGFWIRKPATFEVGLCALGVWARRRRNRLQVKASGSSTLDEVWQLGGWKLRGRMVLAPMEQVTDCAFRRLCFELGASFTWTEMVRAASLLKRNKSTTSRLDTFDPSTPTGVQLMVSGPSELKKALQLLEERAQSDKDFWARGIHGIDLNFGCPSPHIINNGMGPAMLGRPQVLRLLFDTLAEWRAKQNVLPVGAIGAKMRLGLNEEEEEREVYLRAIQSAKGRLDYVCLHPRHARDESKNPARWEHIRKAKELAGHRLAIIGNGDVLSRKDAARMICETGCDAVMVARGATKTVGAIFDSSWDDSDLAVVQRAGPTEERLSELSKQFGARPKIAEYHQESFRRVRARGSRQTLRLLWEEMNWFLMRKHRTLEETFDKPLSDQETAEYITKFFDEDVRVQVCSLAPELEQNYLGHEGVQHVLPFFAEIAQAKQDFHMPSEEAEANPMQLVVGFANGCNAMMLCTEANQVRRLSLWCSACPVPLPAPV